MEIRTSKTHPIAVNWVDAPGGHRIGLTFAPGKRHRSSLGDYRWERDLDADLQRLHDHHGAEVLVALLEDHELERFGLGGLDGAAERLGLELRRHPIPDGGLPAEPRRFSTFIETVAGEVANGRSVVVFCRGGLGRTGLTGGCLLVQLGVPAREALSAVKGARGPSCPETAAQRQFVLGFIPAPATPVRATEPIHGPANGVLGSVLGAAIGDAMGHPTEFIRSVDEIRRKYGADGVTGYELWWTRDDARFAPYTDDTQMSEAAMRTLVAHREADLDTAMKDLTARFVNWVDHPQGGHRAPGGACQAGCRALKAGAHWSEAGGATAGGCGSVMRAHPFGLAFADDLAKAEEWAVAQSKLTHRDPIALAASAAMAVGTALSLRGEPPAAVVEAMIDAASRYSEATGAMMRQARDEANRGVGPEVTLQRLEGWAAHEAIAAALYIFARHPDDARTAILEGTNTPGDSDSLASMAGALVGARAGFDGLPRDWVADLERTADLQELAHQLAAGGSKPVAPRPSPSPRFTKPSGKRSLSHILVIDIEATCWPRGQRPCGQENEPIEIGLCVLDTGTLERLEKRSILIRPTRSKVSAFCTELTTLTQAQVDKGITFAEACKILREEYNAPALPWASFGDYDRTALQQAADKERVDSPLGRTHVNVRALLTLAAGMKQEPELPFALDHVGLRMEGTHHRGHDDAWNIAGVLAWVLQRVRASPGR